jgi:hypothetical protein
MMAASARLWSIGRFCNALAVAVKPNFMWRIRPASPCWMRHDAKALLARSINTVNLFFTILPIVDRQELPVVAGLARQYFE